MGIICACMPALKAFVQHHIPSLFGSAVRSSSARQLSRPWENSVEGGACIEGNYVELGKGPKEPAARRPADNNRGQDPEITTMSHS